MVVFHGYLHSMAFSKDLKDFGRLLRKFCILFKASIAVPECRYQKLLIDATCHLV